MFYYLGRKGKRLAETYPAPLFPLVIEPFAGSMGYTMFHRPRYAIGIEADENVVDVWERLCAMTLPKIRAMRVPEVGERTEDLYWKLAFASTNSLSSHYRTVNDFIHIRLVRQKRLTIRHHTYASRHVLYSHGDYTEAPDLEATWFIDPPYVDVEHGYQHQPDYKALAEWCLTRRGQVIVCEGAFGNWLAFQNHRKFRGINDGNGQRRDHQERTWVAPIRVCKCGARFKPTKTSHVFCSTRCRVAAHREAGRNA